MRAPRHNVSVADRGERDKAEKRKVRWSEMFARLNRVLNDPGKKTLDQQVGQAESDPNEKICGDSARQGVGGDAGVGDDCPNQNRGNKYQEGQADISSGKRTTSRCSAMFIKRSTIAGAPSRSAIRVMRPRPFTAYNDVRNTITASKRKTSSPTDLVARKG